jgi:hypothetical protein
MWNRGMRWQEIQNPEFYTLAMIAAEESYPDMENIGRQHDGSIDAVFGSMCANIMLRATDGEISSVFTSGHCAALAWAIHQNTGLPIAVFTNPDSNPEEWTGHVAIKLGEDEFLDITGIRTAESIRKSFRNLDGTHEVMDDEEFLNRIVEESYRADPLSAYCDLERFIVEDFAEFVIVENNVKVPTA